MSNEISMGTTLSLAVGSLNLSMNVGKSSTQTTAGGVQRRQSVPTSDTVLTMTGVTTPRAILIKNTDATNYINIGPTVAAAIAPAIRLQAGESCLLPMYPGVVLRGQANSAAVIIEVLILET